MTDINTLVLNCNRSLGFFFKYISANDAGTTGAHQSGLYMPRSTWPLFLSREGRKGENIDAHITIVWDLGVQTDSRYVWYGNGTRSEYRLTGGITFIEPDNVGDIVVLIKQGDSSFIGYMLTNDDDVEDFFNSFNLSPVDSCILQRPVEEVEVVESKLDLFRNWLAGITVGFPPGAVISAAARWMTSNQNGIPSQGYDEALLNWTYIEYELFKFIEADRYSHFLSRPFRTLSDLIDTANTILNRRKSRAGHSLEYHLSHIFDIENIPYSSQQITEGNRKPDFIFPGITQYHDTSFPEEDITFLAAKTTCKDRWRQILNEASRSKQKHLITLQQGISANQLIEMEEEGVTLVVPSCYHHYFPIPYRFRIHSVNSFIQMLHQKYNS